MAARGGARAALGRRPPFRAAPPSFSRRQARHPRARVPAQVESGGRARGGDDAQAAAPRTAVGVRLVVLALNAALFCVTSFPCPPRPRGTASRLRHAAAAAARPFELGAARRLSALALGASPPPRRRLLGAGVAPRRATRAARRAAAWASGRRPRCTGRRPLAGWAGRALCLLLSRARSGPGWSGGSSRPCCRPSPRCRSPPCSRAVFALLGMQAFSTPIAYGEAQLEECDRPFGSLFCTSLLLFQVVTTEDWDYIVHAMWTVQGLVGVFFLLAFFIVVNICMLAHGRPLYQRLPRRQGRAARSGMLIDGSAEAVSASRKSVAARKSARASCKGAGPGGGARMSVTERRTRSSGRGHLGLKLSAHLSSACAHERQMTSRGARTSPRSCARPSSPTRHAATRARRRGARRRRRRRRRPPPPPEEALVQGAKAVGFQPPEEETSPG